MSSSGHTLVLLRHAKAEPAGGLGDELRPLSLTGRGQCAEVAAALEASGRTPDHALVSAAVRTRQTWELLSGALSRSSEGEVREDLYGARVADLVDLLRLTPAHVGTLLVVGHEPTMSGTARSLAGDGVPGHLAQVRTGLPTASFAVLGVDAWETLGPGDARLLDVVRPGG